MKQRTFSEIKANEAMEFLREAVVAFKFDNRDDGLEFLRKAAQKLNLLTDNSFRAQNLYTEITTLTRP